MKFWLLALLISVLSLPVFGYTQTGVIASATINSASTSIPTTFAGTNGQALSLTKATKTHIAVINGTSGTVALSISSSTCASGTSDDLVVLGSNGTIALDNINIATKVCVRSLTGSAISTGTLYLMVW